MGLKAGTWAWVGLASYVAAYDLYAVSNRKETLSTAFANGLKHPKRRKWVLISWCYITAHLLRVIPDRYDPLRNFGPRNHPEKG